MIHSTAIIHPDAQIADDVEIGPYTIIGARTVIHAGTKIASHAVIESAEIGENCTIFSHAAVGTAPQDLKYRNEPTRLVLGPRCMIREFVTLNRGTTASGTTAIGADCLFMAYTHVAHDCVIGNSVIMANAATLGGHVVIGDNAFLGGGSMVHQFCRIGRLAMLGGGSMVSQDILPFVQTQGDRAHLVGLNVVGLRRRGYTAETIEDIKGVYRILFMTGLPMEEALDQIEASCAGPEVREMIDFIHISKRGICRTVRKEAAEEV
jgi:UDP-N-acetylglucosamine acyltransferase